MRKHIKVHEKRQKEHIKQNPVSYDVTTLFISKINYCFINRDHNVQIINVEPDHSGCVVNGNFNQSDNQLNNDIN